MSSQSDAMSQSISAPQDGGAVHGSGEKFAPDLFTGTGNITLPIGSPAGRKGFQPQLSPPYSARSGNSLFGLEWIRNVPGVTVKLPRDTPRCRDELNSDVFVFSGAEDLVPVEILVPPITRDEPRMEDLFGCIIHHNPNGSEDNYREAESKNGLMSFYGTLAMAGNDRSVSAAQKKEPLLATKVLPATEKGNLKKQSGSI
jgi:Salmonella virulence plasmid 65kDa B protein